MPTITGTAAGETLVGTTGNDLIQGLGGDDILNGGPAGDMPDTDTLDGGDGIDTFRAGDDASGARTGQAVSIDLASGTATYFYPSLSQNFDTDTLISIENAIGTNLADAIRGDGGANRLEGLGGNDSLEGLGGDDVLIGGLGNDRLIGGAGVDQMIGGAGDDVYEVTEAGDTVVEAAGEGLDVVYSYLSTYTLTANVENLILVGSAQAGTGNGLNNSLYGNDLANVLDGGAGADIVSGYGGDDTYIVDNTGDAVAEIANGGVDTVLSSVNFALGYEVENLTLTGTALSGTGNTSANVLIGNASNNTLSGMAGDDSLTGGSGDDTLDGGDGLDTAVYSDARSAYTVTTTQGRTTVTGPDGTDTLTNVERLQFSDQVVVLSNVITGTAAAETLTGTADSDTINALGGGDTVYGLGGDDIIDGGSGADLLVGGDGDDILFGGVGSPTGGFNPVYDNDVLNGGAGVDTFRAGYETDANLRLTVRLAAGTATYVHNGVLGSQQTETDTLISIENVIGTGSADDIEGDDGVNRLEGGAGGDRLAGLGGDDILIGGAGADTLEGGDGVDTAIYSGARSAYTITTVNGVTAVAGPDGTDTLRGVERLQFTDQTVSLPPIEDEILYGDGAANTIHGYGGNDIIYGLGYTDTLYGDAGDDVLIGGADNDAMYGGTGNDSFEVTETGDVVVELAGEGVDTVFSYLNAYTLGANVENLALIGAAVSGTGNELDNGLVGNAQANTLSGGGGNDVLVGDAGDDVLIGGSGTDIMIGGVGNDVYEVTEAGDIVTENAGEGVDSVFSYVDGYQLTANVETLQLAGSARLGYGNAGDNTLLGTSGDDILIGGAGNDLMQGGLGNDTYEVTDAGDVVSEIGANPIHVNGGYDTVFSYIDGYSLTNGVEALRLVGSAITGYGNALNNILVGNALDNRLIGGAGNDTMIGGLGNDAYEITEAGDVVVEAAGEGADTVYSYIDSYQLTDNVETLALVGSARIGLGNAGANTLIGNAGANVLNGNGGDDVLTGGAGADTFWHLGAAAGNDRITDFASASEVIVLDASVYANFGAVQSHAAQIGANVVITLNASTSLTLANVQLNQLTASNFVFFNTGGAGAPEPVAKTAALTSPVETSPVQTSPTEAVDDHAFAGGAFADDSFAGLVGGRDSIPLHLLADVSLAFDPAPWTSPHDHWA
jgi:Ca2+-binding RTX toxin-like protein